jgi:hypothetical protein
VFLANEPDNLARPGQIRVQIELVWVALEYPRRQALRSDRA